MPVYIDQLGRSVEIRNNPQRIISLVPSQTELLADLGLEDKLIGITKFCVHPEHIFRTKQRVGGTKKVNLKKIRELRPDLIIANKEENQKEQIDELASEFPVWISDIKNLDEALVMISSVGLITGTADKAISMLQIIKKEFEGIDSFLINQWSALYLIWKNPYMCAGKDTFINQMLGYCGLINIVQQDRYPELSKDQIQKLAPDIVLLSSEPYPFKESHIKEINEILPGSEVKIVDGEIFSWYGSRLKYAPSYFLKLKKDLE